MAIVDFSTCCRSTALARIQKVYPSRTITDETIKLLLDLVEKDVVRIQDPIMYGNQIGVVPGNNWNEQYTKEVIEACKPLTHK